MMYKLKLVATLSLLLSIPCAIATDLSLAGQPLYTSAPAKPMMMLVMGRDHTLFYEAYNDASDLDNDGDLDITFTPSISYDGYFDAAKCYDYASGVFSPTRVAATCGGQWSGNFLNYLTMSRMDMLRKVLYGGYRSTDTATSTILQRAFIPQDAHSWGKSYSSQAINGYNINDYSPYAAPISGRQHHFGTTTYTSVNNPPTLRFRGNQTVQVWSWASKERPVLNWGGTDFTVRVAVCVTGLLEDNCKEYANGVNKPTGLLHDYGDNDEMLFGLLSGSYDKNLSGGVLRKAVSKFSGEVNNNGTFVTNSNGIVDTINKFRIWGFNYGSKAYSHSCGWVLQGPISDGKCASWGNPIGEMLYESLRYFAGEQTASASYTGTNAVDNFLGLPVSDWDDPFANSEIKTCSRATNLIISDVNPSYDSDQLPGAHAQFSRTYNGSTLSAFDLSGELNKISTDESLNTGNYFIGQSGTNSDNAPTGKNITGLHNIRGLAPNEPTKEGSFSSAGVASYGQTNDISPLHPGEQTVNTIVVALASSLPEVIVNVDGREIKIVPFAKSVGGAGISRSPTRFQPTNTIVDWYVEELSDTRGVFRINYEDVEQGADHDMDMIVSYEYQVARLCPIFNVPCANADRRNGVRITLRSIYAGGGIDQHAGYVISGTTSANELFLDVKDKGGRYQPYYLDTPLANANTQRADNGSTTDLPLSRTRHFFPAVNEGTAASFLPSPLWYAAKWGGFNDSDGNNKPNLQSEWDADNDGVPDTYFPVTNAGELKSQLSKAFSVASTDEKAAAAISFDNGLLKQGASSYSSSFEASKWSGDVQSYKVSNELNLNEDKLWSAAEELDNQDFTTREIFTRNNEDGSIFKFNTNNITQLSDTQLELITGSFTGSTNRTLAYREAVIKYIKGDRTNESDTSDFDMRERTSALGDIINSTLYSVTASNGHDVARDLLVFGANDGMVHILDSATGEELMAYIPSGVYKQLNALTKPNYIHQYSVDGGITGHTNETTDATVTTIVGSLGTGSKGLYAIDVSDMTSASKNKIKWEITDSSTGYSNLGFTGGTPTIIKLANGDTGVIFANGYNGEETVQGQGTIYIANLENGVLIKALTTGTKVDPTGKNRPNAMSSPAVVDIDNNGTADYIYAGDLYGNMWAFDITDKNTSNWGNKKLGNAPLFTATSRTSKSGGASGYYSQPITTQPQISFDKANDRLLIAFGTGQYIENSDNSVTDQPTQTFYVIRDKYATSSVIDSERGPANGNSYINLVKQRIVKEVLDGNNNLKRHLTSRELDWDTANGFFLDLVNTEHDDLNNYGEKQVEDSIVFDNKVFFTTVLPNGNDCEPGGSSWYMVLDLLTGTSWEKGTIEDDPETSVDESQQISETTSNGKINEIITNSTIIKTLNGDTKVILTTENGNVIEKDFTGSSILGRVSWRQLL
jgi:type IV pilus assembly protein PilY1